MKEFLMKLINLSVFLIFLPLIGTVISLFSRTIINKNVKSIVDNFAGIVSIVFPLILLAFMYPYIKEGSEIDFYVGNHNPLLGIEISFDGLSWLLNLMGLLGALMGWLYTLSIPLRSPTFTAIFSIQTFALLATASSSDLFNLFVCFEILGISSYILVGMAGKRRAFLAAFSYMMVSSVSMLFFLLGVFGIYKITGSLSFTGIIQSLLTIQEPANLLIIRLSIVCIVVATAVRTAILPVYGWLPEAHASAPHGISAILSGVLIKTPLFVLGKFLYLVNQSIPSLSKDINIIFSTLGYAGIITAFIGIILALSQRDVKLILAYSSISQIGYILGAWSLGTPFGFGVAYLHAFAHAMFKGLLFLSIGSVSDVLENRDVYNSRGGLVAGYFPFISFLIGAISISGIPPFNGFVSKNSITYLYKGNWQYILLYVTSIGTMASMIKISQIFLPSNNTKNISQFKKKKISLYALLSMAGYGIICIFTGIFANLWGSIVSSAIGIEKNIISSNIFSSVSYKNTAITFIIGCGIFGIFHTDLGKKIQEIIRSHPNSFEGLLGSFSLALGGLAILILIL